MPLRASNPRTRARSAIVLAATLGGLVTSAAISRPAFAQGTTTSSPHSPYEAAKILQALAHVHGTLEPSPEGMNLEGVDVVSLEVIEDQDPAPLVLNFFHTTTRQSILRREVLLESGEPYRQYRVDDTVRSLRIFQQLSLVLAVPIKGKKPGGVRLLLVTKDVWSLRTNLDMKLGAAGLDLLRFEPTERNLGGTLNSVVTRFELFPKTIALGGGFFVPRLAGKRIEIVTDANAVFNRDSGNLEGSYGTVSATAPQISADTPWLWTASNVWQNLYVRRYVGAKLATFDAPSTPELELVPDVHHMRAITTNAAVTRSFGLAHKLDIAFGAELNTRQFVGLDPNRYDAAVVADYRAKRVPTSDSRAAPWVQIRTYESRFLRVHDFDVLGLQEDYRVGYDAWLRVYPVTRAIGSSRDFLGFHAALQYVLPLQSGFGRATTETITEVQTDGVPTFSYVANVALVSPTLPFGRIVIDGVAIGRPHNYLNLRSALGGETRLRGYPSSAFLGENLVAYNMELRSKPVEVLACQVGSALFFDIGDAFDGNNLRAKSSVGFGFRAVFPQLDRKVFRFDVGFPLVRGGGDGPIGFYLAFEQAFPAAVTSRPGGAAQAMLNPLGGALGQ